MKIEVPPESLKKKNSEPVQGEGFVVKEGISSGIPNETRVEFRPGESSDTVKERKAKKQGKEEKDISQWTDADFAEEILMEILKIQNPYSETFTIKPDGSFEDLRADKKARLQYKGHTPTELYQIAHEIEAKNPEYTFSFETDPQGKWMKYTVAKENN